MEEKTLFVYFFVDSLIPSRVYLLQQPERPSLRSAVVEVTPKVLIPLVTTIARTMRLRTGDEYIFHKLGYGQWTDASWYRRDVTRYPATTGHMAVSVQPARMLALIESDVNYHGVVLYKVAREPLLIPPRSRDDHVALSDFVDQHLVRRCLVDYYARCVGARPLSIDAILQPHLQRFAYVVAPADYAHPFARQPRDADFRVNERNYSGHRCRDEGFVSKRHSTNVERVETVYVFTPMHFSRCSRLIQRLGQRQLNYNPVRVGALVKFLDICVQRFLADVGLVSQQVHLNAGLPCRRHFPAQINLRCRVFTNLDT